MGIMLKKNISDHIKMSGSEHSKAALRRAAYDIYDRRDAAHELRQRRENYASACAIESAPSPGYRTHVCYKHRYRQTLDTTLLEHCDRAHRLKDEWPNGRFTRYSETSRGGAFSVYETVIYYTYVLWNVCRYLEVWWRRRCWFALSRGPSLLRPTGRRPRRTEPRPRSTGRLSRRP